MKNNNLFKYFWLATFISIPLFSNAQQTLPCGNGPINDSALNAAIAYEHTMATHRPQTVNYLVRMYFHVFHNDDGTQGAVTTAQIKSEFASLLASYASDNVCFLFAGIDSVNSTALNQNFNADSDPNGTALSAYQVPGCINSFYMRKINGNNTACSPPCGYGGIALGGIPGTFFLVATSNIGLRSTIGHETGHCLGLLHTFETAFGYEKIDGTNSSTTGDKITDTPADPYAYNGQSCYSVSTVGCTYTGTCTDPNGSTNFTPPYTNLMSYWCTGGPNTTGNQFARVNSMLNTNTALINCSSPASLTISPVTVSSGYYMKSAIGTTTTSGAVIFNGTAKATIGGGTVLLEPGFHATPSAGGLVNMVIKPCN